MFVFLLVHDGFSHQVCDGNIFLLLAWQDLELTWRQDFRHTCERVFSLEEPNVRVIEFHSCKDLQSLGRALNIHLSWQGSRRNTDLPPLGCRSLLGVKTPRTPSPRTSLVIECCRRWKNG